MAWTTPAAATTGATLTKSWLDTYVKDNMVDVGQPALGNAVLTSSVTWISVGSEDYSYTLLLNSLTLSKNTTLSGGVITVSRAGIWAVSASLVWAATASATGSSLRGAKVYINGSASDARSMQPNLQNISAVCTIPTFLVSLAAGNTIELRGWQNSGSTINVSAGSRLSCWLVYRS